MEPGYEIGRIAGVRVSVHWSVLVIWWLLTWSLATVLLPERVSDRSPFLYWLTGGLTALGLLTCLLVHELSHAVAARRQGVETEAITLWALGGMAQMREESPTPRAELVIAGIGPVTSLVVAAAAWSVAALLEALGSTLVAAAFSWLSVVNLVLAVFNLLPGLPLDGGRVLHAVLWRRSGDRLRSTQTTATVGRALGYGLIALGVLEFTAGLWNGLWLVLIGWFLVSAATAEASTEQLRGVLGNLRVAEVMTPDPDVVADWMSVQDLLDGYVLRLKHSTFPVRDRSGHLSGLVTLDGIKAVPPSARTETAVAAIAVPISDVPVAEPDERFVDLLGRLAVGSGRRALVLRSVGPEEPRLVGIITPTDIARAIEVQSLASLA